MTMAPPLGWGDAAPVDVADHVAFVAAPARRDAGQQGGGEVADRRVVMQPAFDDEPVVLGGKLGVGVVGYVGGEPDVAAESGGFLVW